MPQDPHTDYEHGKVSHLLNDPERVPISAIWAACDDFELVDYSNEQVHRVQAGWIAVFRADWWHGGGVGVSPHLRVHGYGATNGVHIPKGATYGGAMSVAEVPSWIHEERMREEEVCQQRGVFYKSARSTSPRSRW